MSDSKGEDIKIIMQRKKDGIDIPLSNNVQSRFSSTYLEYVKLIHNALPEINYQDIDLSTSFLNHKFACPIIIDSMTGNTGSFKNQLQLRQDSRKIPTGHGAWKSEGRIKK
jgi:isopentenyl diphosphate isomerase/L-lactate dehydrogenase-like FMN-dependent dehydrogenase